MKIFRGGIPTKIDVDRLLFAFGTPPEGQLITHEEIEELIGISRQSSRYKTVISAWRRILEAKHNIILGARPGEGLVALNPEERINMASGKFATGIRATGRASNVAMSTDRARLCDEAKKAQDFLRNINARLRLAAATAAKELVYPEPTVNSIYHRKAQ